MTRLQPLIASLAFFIGLATTTSAQGSLLGRYAGRGDFLSNTSWGTQTDRSMKLELRFLDNGLLLYRDCWALEPLPLCVGSQLRVVGGELWHQDRKVGLITDALIVTEYHKDDVTITSRLERFSEGYSFESVYQERGFVTRKKALLVKTAEEVKTR